MAGVYIILIGGELHSIQVGPLDNGLALGCSITTFPWHSWIGEIWRRRVCMDTGERSGQSPYVTGYKTYSTRVKAPSNFFPQVASGPSPGPVQKPRAWVNDAVFSNFSRRKNADKPYTKKDARRVVLLSAKSEVTIGMLECENAARTSCSGSATH